MKNRTKVFIADYHALVRQGLKSLMRGREDMEVVGEAGRGTEVLDLVFETKPDLLIMDPFMPDWNGLGAIGELKERVINVKTLILTDKEDEETVFEVYNSGADGLCLKSSTFGELLLAIRLMMNGKRYFSPELSGKLLKGFLNGGNGNGVKPQHIALTHREKEVLKLLGKRLNKKTVAERLEISLKTVEKHMSNIMKKLNVHKLEGLIAYAVVKEISEG